MRHIAFKVTAIYTVFGVLWILFSDLVVEMFVQDVTTLTQVQMIKGWFFVFCTALILFLLVRRYTAMLIYSDKALCESEIRHRSLFEDAPISLLEEDFSVIKKNIIRLRESGITDFRTYFETHPEIVRECSEKVRIIDVNRAALEMFQAESREALVTNLGHVFKEQSYEVFREELISLAEGRYIFESEAVNQTLQGNEIYVSLKLTVAPGYEDTWSKVLISLADITGRRQAEKRLYESEKLFSLFMDHLPAAVFIKDEENRTLYVNRYMKEVFGVKDWTGKTVQEFLPEDVAESMIADDKKALSEGYLMVVETVPYKDGNKHIYQTRKFAIRRTDKPSLLGGIALNITKEKGAEDELEKYRNHLEKLVKQRTAELREKNAELEKANTKLQELDRLKSMFIASMSHELRTPLNSIIGFTGIILQGLTGEINAEQTDQLQRVHASARHLLELLTDLIDISKIEAGKIESYAKEFDLNGVIKEARSILTSEINNQGLGFETILPPELQLKTDRKRLLQCIVNLLSNAVKFTEKGKIKISAHEVDGIMEIKVKDTGIGIKKENISRLFEPFVRLDTPLKPITPGTGLGLYLTKKLAVEVLKGSVSVESRHGEGSAFTLKIPKEI